MAQGKHDPMRYNLVMVCVYYYSTTIKESKDMDGDRAVSGKKIVSREKNIESLRVVAAMMVVSLHSLASFIIKYIPGWGASNHEWHTELYTALSLGVFARVAVPIFVMISGKYLMDKGLQISAKEFYRTKLKRIAYPLVFWGILHSIYNIIYVQSTTMKSATIDFFKGTPYIHLWYLYMILGLYLIIPILWKVKGKLSPKAYKIFSVVFILIAPVFEFTMQIQVFQLFTYIGYFTMGDILKDYIVSDKKNKLYLGGYLASILLAIGATLYMFSMKITQAFVFSSGTIYTTTIATICLFIFFNGLKNKETILNKISKYTLGIYCIHHVILDVIVGYTGNTITGIMIVDASIYAVVTFALSLMITMMLNRVRFMKKFI